MDKNTNSQRLLGCAHSVYHALSPPIKGPGDKATLQQVWSDHSSLENQTTPFCSSRWWWCNTPSTAEGSGLILETTWTHRWTMTTPGNWQGGGALIWHNPAPPSRAIVAWINHYLPGTVLLWLSISMKTWLGWNYTWIVLIHALTIASE